jgi:hypothetical protein
MPELPVLGHPPLTATWAFGTHAGQILLPHRCSSCAYRFFRPRWANPPLPSQHSDYEDYKQPRWDEKAPTLLRREPELRVDEEPETAAPSTETAERLHDPAAGRAAPQPNFKL